MLGCIGGVQSAESAALEELGGSEELAEAVMLEPEWLTLASVGRLVCSLLLLLGSLEPRPCCISDTPCADNWSCTYSVWSPIPRLMVRGARPERKSLICRIIRKQYRVK